MARRRRSALRPLLLLIVVAATAYGAWRYGPQLWRRISDGAAPAAASDAACALADAAAVAGALGIGAVQAQPLAPETGVPAAGGCRWEFDGIGAARGHASVLLFTPASLARGNPALAGAAHFRSSVTGLEYAWKETPRALDGLGDEAAIAGFNADSPRDGELLVRRGERVLDLVVEGADAAAARRLAAALAAGL